MSQKGPWLAEPLGEDTQGEKFHVLGEEKRASPLWALREGDNLLGRGGVLVSCHPSPGEAFSLRGWRVKLPWLGGSFFSVKTPIHHPGEKREKFPVPGFLYFSVYLWSFATILILK